MAFGKLDQPANAERRAVLEAGDKPEPWVHYFDLVCEQAQRHVYAQLQTELGKLLESGSDSSSEA